MSLIKAILVLLVKKLTYVVSLYNPEVYCFVKKKGTVVNINKKIGIAIFLVLVGTVEARDRKTNSPDKPKKVVPVIRKVPKSPTVKSKKLAERKQNFKIKEQQRKHDRQEYRKKQVVWDPQFDRFEQNVSFGFSRLHKKKLIKLIDEDANADTIVIDKSCPAGIFGYTLAANVTGLPKIFKKGESTEARFGIATSFSKKEDAYQGTYIDTGSTHETSLLKTRQNIKCYQLLVTSEYDLFEKYGWTYSLNSALGLSVGALRELRINREIGNFLRYTGKHFRPKKSRPTAQIGFSVHKKMGPITGGIRYTIGYTKQTYQAALRLDEPYGYDARTKTGGHVIDRDNYNNQSNSAIRGLLITTPPVFKLLACNLQAVVGFDF